MGLILDSNVLIAAEKNQISLQSLAKNHSGDDLFLSVISASELLEGVHAAKSVNIKRARKAFVESLLEFLTIIPIDLTTARIHAEILYNLRSKGKVIHPHDLCIGATAIAHGHCLATLNIKDFEKIKGLNLKRVS